MDPVRNPFAPGAGTPPPELAGRRSIITDIDIALQRIAIGRPTQSAILVGLRGVGKTVLLNKAREIAEIKGYKAYLAEAHEGKTLPETIGPGLKSVLLSLSYVDSAKEHARRGLRVLKSFFTKVSVSAGGFDIGLTLDAEPGSADSGDIEHDLPTLFLAVAEAAKAANRPVVLLIDELQYLSVKEFSALIMSIHRISQTNLPLTLVGAGLPQILALAGESKSYSEQLFKYPSIGALTDEDAIDAIVKPVRTEGAMVTDDALREILRLTERYPYFLQQWGHDAWNAASGNVITKMDVETATEQALATLDENFFKVRFDRCNPSEKKYMRALAELGPGTQKSGDIANQAGQKTTSAAPTRNNLIKKGMIYSPRHGETAFTVPLFDAYMRRTMPARE
ncbi:ATP-binding protein [Methylobacterium isbiliense]|uniref:Orc1-like AAA ATPase domain-containing protein n=1 Tax=Methylobacterium isbiliense TaxID=315478 RepID=A0ABQ4SGA8_9HYPH|nr:ATP-binding protein [Methylobacterium isbiliense]MDN3622390.1 ATP-binding protein [Methylobacterium isbiliense]GJE01579.1 hypothetical protein GMJLKIPL_3513 [Methylobacterium isbiliense]